MKQNRSRLTSILFITALVVTLSSGAIAFYFGNPKYHEVIGIFGAGGWLYVIGLLLWIACGVTHIAHKVDKRK